MCGTDPFPQGTRVVLTYDRDGRSYEESVLIMWNYMVSAWQGQVTSGIWAIPAMYSLRGPVGTDYLNDPEMIAILSSVRIHPAWQAEMNKYWAQLAQIQHKGNMDRLNASAAAHQKRMDTLNETSDIIMSGWKSRNTSLDRMQARTIDAIHEQTPYTIPSGETVKLPSFYNNVYTDGNGRYILNNDSLYEPNTDPAVNSSNWQRIEAQDQVHRRSRQRPGAPLAAKVRLGVSPGQSSLLTQQRNPCCAPDMPRPLMGHGTSVPTYNLLSTAD